MVVYIRKSKEVDFVSLIEQWGSESGISFW